MHRWVRGGGRALRAVGAALLVTACRGGAQERGAHGQGRGDCLPLGADVSDGHSSLAALAAHYGPAAQGPVGSYILCMSAQDPEGCARLEPRHVEGCRLDAEQIAARATHPTGWALGPTLLRVCAAHGMDDAGCRRWAAAVEAGDPGRCGTLPAEVFCEAAASGEAARCRAFTARETRASCELMARNYAALRVGVAALERDGDPNRASLAAGVRLGPAGCLTRLQSAYTAACHPVRPR